MIQEWREEGQWIVLMGFMVSLGIFFLALIINQSTIVGQTTAEGVLEFPKNDVQDVRTQVLDLARNTSAWWDLESATNPDPAGDGYHVRMAEDIENLSQYRKNAIARYSIGNYCDEAQFGACEPGEVSYARVVTIHYNNGVFEYDETTNLFY